MLSITPLQVNYLIPVPSTFVTLEQHESRLNRKLTPDELINFRNNRDLNHPVTMKNRFNEWLNAQTVEIWPGPGALLADLERPIKREILDSYLERLVSFQEWINCNANKELNEPVTTEELSTFLNRECTLRELLCVNNGREPYSTVSLDELLTHYKGPPPYEINTLLYNTNFDLPHEYVLSRAKKAWLRSIKGEITLKHKINFIKSGNQFDKLAINRHISHEDFFWYTGKPISNIKIFNFNHDKDIIEPVSKKALAKYLMREVSDEEHFNFCFNRHPSSLLSEQDLKWYREKNGNITLKHMANYLSFASRQIPFFYSDLDLDLSMQQLEAYAERKVTFKDVCDINNADIKALGDNVQLLKV